MRRFMSLVVAALVAVGTWLIGTYGFGRNPNPDIVAVASISLGVAVYFALRKGY